jgi:cytochrome c oxidase cbb3-type subunit 3
MQLIKKITATAICSLVTILSMAETTAKAPSSSSSFDADTMLVVCIGLLAIVIISLANTLLFAMKFYKERTKLKKNSSANTMKAVMMIGFTLMGFLAMAETPNLISNTVVNETGTSAFRMILYIIVGLEMIVVFLFTAMIKFFMKWEMALAVQAKSKPLFNINYKKIWEKMNRFKPLEEEASIDTGHSYDGIHELNNITPPWFKFGFIISILAAGVYLYHYEVSKSGPSQEDEYKTEMAEAAAEHEVFIKAQKSNVDENTVVMLAADGIAEGAGLYKASCVACHGTAGQGGVGPNLTDEYWLHGGGIKDVFKSIKYGWKDKGMQAWESNFSSEQMSQLTSFVKSLNGTKPVGGKEPQGEVYKEVVDSAIAKVMVDSVSNK